MDADPGPPDAIAFAGSFEAEAHLDINEALLALRFALRTGEGVEDQTLVFEYADGEERLFLSVSLTEADADGFDFRRAVDADTEATGTVKWFNTTKGYGFIAPDDGGKGAALADWVLELDLSAADDPAL